MVNVSAGLVAVTWRQCITESTERRCLGEQIPGYGKCLSCLSPTEFAEFLDALAPGARLDLRGTALSVERLERVKHACGRRFASVRLGDARLDATASFASCVFDGAASFPGATFEGSASFHGASFKADADLRGTRWFGAADFVGAEFDHQAAFTSARFEGEVDFSTATFTQSEPGADFTQATFAASTTFHQATLANASFRAATFANVRFTEMTLAGRLDLAGTVVAGDADFCGTVFAGAAALGPIVAGGKVSFGGAEFEKPARIVASASSLSLCDATLKAGGVLLVRRANVTLDRAVLDEPLTVVAHELEPRLAERVLPTERLGDDRPRLVSMNQVDSTNLSLVDIDLAGCRFAGAFHLDKLVMEGRCTFASQPPGWWRTRRSVIAEEIAYRAQRSAPWQRLAAGLALTAGAAQTPQRLASLYRQLRKAQEDVKNEPGAGDFYYAEMEMRRHSTAHHSVERLILFLYWVVGGYGLRAWRPLAALGVAVLLGSFAFVAWPATESVRAPAAVVTTQVPQPILPSSMSAPPLSPPPSPSAAPSPTVAPVTTTAAITRPTADTTWPKALQLALESALSLLRAPSLPVSDRAAWVQLALRLLGPVLLALAVLGIRNRVKR